MYFTYVDKNSEAKYLSDEAMENVSKTNQAQLSTFSNQEPVDFRVSAKDNDKNSNDNRSSSKGKGKEPAKGGKPSWFKGGNK